MHITKDYKKSLTEKIIIDNMNKNNYTGIVINGEGRTIPKLYSKDFRKDERDLHPGD